MVGVQVWARLGLGSDSGSVPDSAPAGIEDGCRVRDGLFVGIVLLNLAAT